MRRAAAVACAVMIASSAQAARLSIEEILSRMKLQQAQVQDSSFKFVMHARKGQFQGRTTGEIQMKKPNRLKVLQATPHKQTILTDGDVLWLYTPKQQQVLVGSWKDWVEKSNFPLPLMDFIGLFESGSWLDRYQGTLEGYEDKQYKIRFVNRVPDSAPPVLLWVSDETFLPVQGFVYYMGAPVQVRLKEIKTNPGFTAEQFEPKFPAGTHQIPFNF